MRLTRFSLLVASALVGATASLVSGAVAPTDAHASVSIAVAFDALVKDADSVGVATPVETKSVWEDGRIYTYTRVRIDQGIAGELATGDGGWIRTMGGIVGKIGQLVDGEPVFTPGKPSLIFLRKFGASAGKSANGGTWEVSARAQGQYPVITDETAKVRKVIRSAAVGVLYPPKVLAQVPTEQPGPVRPQAIPKGAAADAAALSKIRMAGATLHDRTLDEVSKEIATAWKRLHPAATPSDAKK